MMKKLLLVGLWIIILSIAVISYIQSGNIDTSNNKTLIHNGSSTTADVGDNILLILNCESAADTFDRDNTQIGIDCAVGNAVNWTNGTHADATPLELYEIGDGVLTEPAHGASTNQGIQFIFRGIEYNSSTITDAKNNELNLTFVVNFSHNTLGADDTIASYVYNVSSALWVACASNTNAGPGRPHSLLTCGSDNNITDMKNFFNTSGHSNMIVTYHGTIGGDSILDGGYAFGSIDISGDVVIPPNNAFQCQTGPSALNSTIVFGFDFFEEINQTDVETTDGEAFFEFYTANNQTPFNLSISSFDDLSQLTICVEPFNQTFIVNATIEFEDSGFRLNNHYLRNSTANTPFNSTTNISLFMLRDEDGTGTSILIRDENRDPMEDIIAFVQRFDQGTNTFRTISMIRSDSAGQDFIYLQHDDAWYRFIFTRDLNVLQITEIQRVTSTALEFDIFPSPFSNKLETLGGVSFNLTYNDNLGRYQVIFLDPTGSVVEGCLQVSRDNQFNRTYLFNDCVTTSFGTLSYTPNNLTGTYYTTFYFRLPSASPDTGLSDTITIIIGAITDVFDIGGKEGAALLFLGLTVMVPFTAMLHIYIPFILLPLTLIVASSEFLGIFDISALVGGGILVMGIAIIIWIESRKK